MGYKDITIRLGINSHLNEEYIDIKQTNDCLKTYGDLLHTSKFRLEPYEYTLLDDLETIKDVRAWLLRSIKYELIYNKELKAVKFKVLKFASHDRERTMILAGDLHVKISEYLSTLLFLNQEMYKVFDVSKEHSIYGFLTKDDSLFIGFNNKYVSTLCESQKLIDSYRHKKNTGCIAVCS
ncbi:MAG: hypothetical protein K2O40_06760 [Lachnospiraceae bacterium]|nr:hypothetical protein [Lachnospiraceae bacterium]